MRPQLCTQLGFSILLQVDYSVTSSSMYVQTFVRLKIQKKTLSSLVYVIGLHAVQFGNNWMRKIRPLQFGSPRNFLNPIISKLDKHVPITY